MAGGGKEQWSSRMAFIFAAVGSAVGLGNIWRFPYMAGENGGGAFVLIYIAFVVLIGLPVLMSELTIGRYGGVSPIGSIKLAAKKSKRSPKWKYLGYLGTFAGGLGLLSYYSVIAGWVLAYIIKAGSGMFVGIEGTEATAMINGHYENTGTLVFWHLVFIGITIFIVGRGINAGLEKAVTYLMPLLFLILLVLVGFSMAQGSFQEAVTYLFEPDFSKVTGGTVLAALGQALFSLSVAVGTMLAYGAYLPKTISIPKSAGIIAASDTGVALIAGLAIFPLVFAYNLEPNAGPGLIFETLPIAFGAMPGGQIFGTLFFILLGIAAITSSISLLEPAVSYLEEKANWNRWKSAFLAGGAAFLFGLLSVFSYNIWSDFEPLSIIGVGGNFFTVIDFTVSNIVMPLGALLISVFVGWKVLPKILSSELNTHKVVLDGLRGLTMFFAPAVLILIIISGLFGLSLSDISAWIGTKPLLETALSIMFVIGLLIFSLGLVYFIARVYIGEDHMDSLMSKLGLKAEAAEKAMSFLIYYGFMLWFITSLLL